MVYGYGFVFSSLYHLTSSSHHVANTAPSSFSSPSWLSETFHWIYCSYRRPRVCYLACLNIAFFFSHFGHFVIIERLVFLGFAFLFSDFCLATSWLHFRSEPLMSFHANTCHYAVDVEHSYAAYTRVTQQAWIIESWDSRMIHTRLPKPFCQTS